MYVRLSVCMYVRFWGNVIFSAPNWDIALIFCVQIPLINENLFCKYFFRLSVGNATKGFAPYGCFHSSLFYIDHLNPAPHLLWMSVSIWYVHAQCHTHILFYIDWLIDTSLNECVDTQAHGANAQLQVREYDASMFKDEEGKRVRQEL